MIVIKESFIQAEVLELQKQGDSPCTPQNFRFIDFEGQTAKVGDKSAIAKYLLGKAVEQGAKKEATKRQSKKTD